MIKTPLSPLGRGEERRRISVIEIWFLFGAWNLVLSPYFPL
jgi:hypothetical protein